MNAFDIPPDTTKIVWVKKNAGMTESATIDDRSLRIHSALNELLLGIPSAVGLLRGQGNEVWLLTSWVSIQYAFALQA